MRITHIEVNNFRAIPNSEMSFDPLVAIIGENNTGKSAFLSAINIFFDSAPKITRDDFHKENIEQPIEISITFDSLTPDESTKFSSKIINDCITVSRKLYYSGDREYLVVADVFPGFHEIRSESNKAPKIAAYRAIAEEFGLPSIRSADEIEKNLENWEREHTDLLERQKVANFFGFESVANNALRAKTNVIFVPAIKDAKQEIDGSKSPVKQLLLEITKQSIENNEDYKKFIEEASEKLLHLTSPERAPQLQDISGELTDIIQRYYIDAQLSAFWDPVSKLPMTVPEPFVKVSDGYHVSSVDYVGHGLQRAIVLTLLEYIAKSKVASDGSFVEAQSDIIILIEEPELFQHPIKQRLFYECLYNLVEEFNAQTGIRFQIVYATHSPLMISLRHAQNIRSLYKRMDGDAIALDVRSTSIAHCAEITASCLGKTPNPEHFAISLHIINSDVGEVFFAKKVILVEEVSDVAILEAYYRQKNRNILSEGIVIKSVHGKKNLDKPFVILKELGIPVYVIFDSDRKDKEGSKKNEQGEISWNLFAQKMFGRAEDSYEDWPDTVENQFAAWNGNIEKYISNVSGFERYEAAKSEMSANFEINAGDCSKSPVVAGAILARLLSEKCSFTRLDAIIERVDALE